MSFIPPALVRLKYLIVEFVIGTIFVSYFFAAREIGKKAVARAAFGPDFYPMLVAVRRRRALRAAFLLRSVRAVEETRNIGKRRRSGPNRRKKTDQDRCRHPAFHRSLYRPAGHPWFYPVHVPVSHPADLPAEPEGSHETKHPSVRESVRRVRFGGVFHLHRVLPTDASGGNPRLRK